jgi:hypothetical protein
MLALLAMATLPIPALQDLPLWDGRAAEGDWLVRNIRVKAQFFRTERPGELVMANGLIARRFLLQPNAATLSFDNLKTGETLLRAVKPEAEVVLEGKAYPVGGLTGQPNLAFLTEDWIGQLKSGSDAFVLKGFAVGPAVPRMAWKQVRRAAPSDWPVPGVALTLTFGPPKNGPKAIEVDVRYEMIDGAPILTKRLIVRNLGDKAIRVDAFKAEILGLVEPESAVDDYKGWQPPNLTVTTDYTFAGMSLGNSNQAVRLLPDPAYGTQVNYNLKTPCLLEVAPPVGPGADLNPGGSLESFNVFELIHDGSDRERRGLAVRKLYRLMAPWTTESPLMLHQTSTDPTVVKTAIDQAAECGFEMVILSFGSGLNMEDASPANIAKFRALADYAHAKNIEFGGYSLLASRRIDDANDVIDPKTGKPGGAVFGNSPCLESSWGRRYFANLEKFIQETGFDLLEHDGSYPGDVCASTTHPGHRGLEDSQWNQYRKISEFYRRCRAKGIYLNVPDNYHLAGSNKTGMGYRETNWSLPRAQQHIHARQNLFDGTWEKPPTMGWMMTPLVEYHGGGPAATIEPLKEHIADYELHLINNLGFGAQACYRGPRLYDSPEVKAMVQKHVAWFKEHRDILESDVVHVKRADGRNLDAILHVNPSLPIRGLAMVWNPTDKELAQEMTLPLYYTGLSEAASVAEKGGRPQRLRLDREYRVRIRPKVPARGWTWYVIR